MKIAIEKKLVSFTPESDSEMKEMNALWNLIVDCVKFNKKLVPVGEFMPPKTTIAQFAIEE
ncbi:MAG: hypothetical protein KKE17_00305 [Proteobacteria bacterium]|nr:hypothetical protein [Pseudomonadota bacterium]MBU1708423.1 hypothetical protein [Pseudomonadota bacterium]